MSNQNNIVCWQIYNFGRSGYITCEWESNYNQITGIRGRVLSVSFGFKQDLHI